MSFAQLIKLVYGQWFIKPAYPTQSCEGKTIIITGANIGLGYEAAKHFVRLGASKVILAVRSVAKGEEAKKRIEKDEHSSGVVEVWDLDLARYDSVKAFAARVDTLDRIDAVLENAGVATRAYTRAEDNESTITINVVSTFLLALLILPALRRSAAKHNIAPTLSVVSSGLHAYIAFSERTAQPSIFAHLNDESKANMVERYSMSKLLEVLVVRELCENEIRKPYPVIMNVLTPGFCHSGLTREMEGQWGMWLMKRVLAWPTEMGSRTLVHGTLAGKETHGKYLQDCVVSDPSSLVMSDEGKKAQERVWGELSQKLEAIQPGILKNL